MITLQADETKQFMRCLLKTDAFDNFLLYSLSIDTLYNLSVDGAINQAYLSTEQKEIYDEQSYVTYTQVKAFLTDTLKQSHTPTGMKITFILNKKSTEDIQRRILGDSILLPIQGFLINVVFDGTVVRVTTGTNYATFTLDKSIERTFDDMIKQFFIKNEILMIEV